MDLSNNIRMELARQKRTVTDLAKHLGISRTAASYFVNGKLNIPDRRLQQIAEFLNKTTDELKKGE